MIEKTIIDYLTQRLSVPVNVEKLYTNGKFVVLEKVGGGETNHIKRSSVALQSYGDTMLEAAELNDEIKELMKSIIELPAVSSCRLDKDYNFTDTTTKQYRYQAVFDLVHY